MSKIQIETLGSLAGALILGAPGSGKTELIKNLVTHFEANGLDQADLLVLTPSRNAANQLRDELALGSSRASSAPRARSISSFAFSVVKTKNPKVKLISGAQQQALIAKLLEAAIKRGDHLKWGIDRATVQLGGFQQELRDLLSVLIENRVSQIQLESLCQRYETKGLRVALDVYADYLTAASELSALDPSELVVLATDSIAEENFPKVLLVDDAQDLSEAALQLVEKLAIKTKSYIFGDPDASALGFRSAGESFVTRFPGLERISLQVGYQNPARAQLLPKIASRIPAGLTISHRPKAVAPEPVTAEIFENTSDESDWLAANLRKARLVDQLSWNQMAVIARTRTQLDQLAKELTSRNVPVRILGAQQALKFQPAALAVLEFGALAFQLRPIEKDQLLRSSVVGLDAIETKRLFRELAKIPDLPSSKAQLANQLFEDLIDSDSFEVRRLNQATQLRLSLVSNPEISAYAFVSKVIELMPLKRLQTLARGRGNIALAANRELDALLELVAAAQRFDLRGWGKAKDFVLQQLDLAIPEDSLAPIGLRPAVTLATSSQLAGKHFALLALPRMQDGIWPNLRPRSALLGASSLQSFLLGRLDSPKLLTKAELQDEIRLFYKAIGAASGSLLISAIAANDEAPSQFLTMFGIEQKSNSFGMDFDLRRQVGKLRKRAVDGDQQALATLATLALAGVPGAHPKNWQGLLELSTDQSIFIESEPIRISASKLEAFEKCPLHWFVETFAGEMGSFQASLGTLLHAALEASANGSDVAEYVQSNWHTLEFESQWHSLAQQRRSARMVSMISEYLSQADPLEAAEQAFQVSFGKLLVSGKIDRLERSETGLRVVDLKTGKPPTAQEVATNRQLALYQLALQNQGSAVVGARIVSVGGDTLRVIDQPEIQDELRTQISELLDRAAKEVAGNQFLAVVSSHCSEDANCQLLIAKAVQHA